MGMADQRAGEASRIENDVEKIKSMTDHIERSTERIIRHARMLGYYEPTPETKVAPPTPIITTLADALGALDRAIDHCSGSLNVFD